jgi:cobyric acid synthase
MEKNNDFFDDNKQLLLLEIIQAFHDRGVAEAFYDPQDQISDLMDKDTLRENVDAKGTISKVFNQYLHSIFLEKKLIEDFPDEIQDEKSKQFKEMKKLYTDKKKFYKKFQDLIEKAFK